MSTQPEKAPVNPDVKEDIEEVDEQKKVLDAINEKAKDNLPLKLKLLALFHYSQIESEQTEQMEKEIDGVSLTYKKKALPLINKINDVVTGKKLEEEDIKEYNQFFDSGADEKKQEALESTQPIEGYWLKVFKGSLILKEEVKAHDEEALKALQKIEVVISEDPAKPNDFTLKFTFGPNECFENDVVIKEFTMKDERDCLKTECTEIKWKEGKNPTKKIVKKKQKNKKSGQSRTVAKEVDQESFFTFFRNMEAKEDEPQDDDDEEPEEELDHIDRHTDIGHTILEEILPYSSEYYLGVRKESQFGDFGQFGAPGGDDDDDDEDDDDKKKSTKGKAAVGGDPKQECKQQ